jgi:hypothetical protein
MSKSVPHTHRGRGRWIWSSLFVMILLGPCGACWGLTKHLYESSGTTPGPRPYPSQGLTTPTNTLGFQELWHFELDGLEEDRESLLIADVDGDGAEELLLNTADRNRLQVLQDGRVVAEVQLQIPGRAWLGRSRALPGTSQAKILSSGVHLSRVDLVTGERRAALGQVQVSDLESAFFADLTGDERDEFIISHKEEGGWRTTVFDAEGEPLWHWPGSLVDLPWHWRDRMPTLPYVGDLEGDGERELVTPSWSLVRGSGEVTPIAPQGPDTRIFWAGDADHDGKVELAAGLAPAPGYGNQPFGLYDLAGAPRWTYTGSEVSGGVVGDVDGDGNMELAIFDAHYVTTGFSSRAVEDAERWIFLFDTDGNLLWNYTLFTRALYPGGFADVNGDGRDELVFFQPAPGPRRLYVYGIVP